MNTAKRIVLGMGMVLSVTACNNHGAASGPSPDSSAMVEVTNNNWSDMVVYAVRSGSRHRLGLVTSMQTARFALPSSMSLAAGSVELLADPVGSTRTFNTGPIVVNPGQRIDFTIQNNLRISSYAVWNR